MAKVTVGIIGGSGLDDPDILKSKKEVEVPTPFGKPSDVLIKGQISKVNCVLLARHGRQHTINPTNVNYRANLWALKELGCTHIITSNACGSLKEEIKPGDLVFIDQFIDRTTKREYTFYDGHNESPPGVCHIPMDSPFCEKTRQVLIETTKDSFAGFSQKVHNKGTIIVIEGPRYSTTAESNLFRTWGADLVGMTTCPEAALAKELGLCYATIGMATDYDCWRTDGDTVTVEKAMNIFKKNAHKTTQLLHKAVPKIASLDWSDCTKNNAETVKKGIVDV